MLGTIVVADSSRTVRRMVEISLAKHPCNLVFASDGASALELVQTESPAMAIIDVALPGGGYDVAAKIKAGGKTKVLLLVGRSQNFDTAQAQKARVDGHLQKPFLTQPLVEKVFGALGQPVPDKAVFRSTMQVIPLKGQSGTPGGARPSKPGGRSSLPPPSSRQAPPSNRPSSGSRLPPPVRKSSPPAMSQSAAPPPPPGPPGPPSAPAAPRRSVPSVPPVSADAAPAPPSRAPAPPPMDAFASSAVKATMQAIASDSTVAAALDGASREVVEQVAWEVVPRLAEAILKEEIARLVRERLAAS